MAQTGNDAVMTDPHHNAMDYAEHDKTYSRFMLLVKWGIVFNVILLISMAIGFFGGWGYAAFLVFVVLHIIAFIAL